MARPRKPAVEQAPPVLTCRCGHPKARHWSGLGGYSRLCLHRQVTGELCLCLDYVDDLALAA